jgi:hypothetical protein
MKSSIPDVLSTIYQDAQNLKEKVKKVKSLLERDMAVLEDMRLQVSQDLKNAEMAGRYIGKYMNPHQLTFTSKSDDDVMQYSTFSLTLDILNSLPVN